METVSELEGLHLDKGKSMFVLAKAAGAEFYDMGAAGSGVQLCPLREIDDPADIAWAVDYVESLCALGGTTITAKHRNAINQAVKMLRNSPTRSLTERSRPYRTKASVKL